MLKSQWVTSNNAVADNTSRLAVCCLPNTRNLAKFSEHSNL